MLKERYKVSFMKNIIIILYLLLEKGLRFTQTAYFSKI